MKTWIDHQRNCFVFEAENEEERLDLIRRFGPFDKEGGATERSVLWKYAAHFDGTRLRYYTRPERSAASS
jgi:hypothetical protein